MTQNLFKVQKLTQIVTARLELVEGLELFPRSWPEHFPDKVFVLHQQPGFRVYRVEGVGILTLGFAIFFLGGGWKWHSA